ncbi:MAG TPA: CpsD/CapB family tyrosine-protein kinase [Polyangia bacterium]|nr:CpsD/CapB family tyrosine-protein kinase [Polyangia bacterium]
MAEPPRRGGPGGAPPPAQGDRSARVTLERTAPPAPRTTAPMGIVRGKSGEKIASDEETRMDPQPTTRTQKFLPEDLVQTTLSPSQQLRQAQQRQRIITPPGPVTGADAMAGRPRVPTPMATTIPERQRITTPMGTLQSEPPSAPSVIVASQQILTREVPPELLERLANEGASAGTGANVTMPNAEVRVNAAVPARRTQVWVATHKPPDDPDARLVMVRQPDSPQAASYRVLRHRLQERGDPRIIAVTSAGPKEGKTTCAVNLALALGECGRARVLLVEANLRSPSLAPLFGFMPPQCFSVQMQKHREKPADGWSVVEVFSEYLHVLAVEPSDRGRPLLDGPAFANAIEALSQAGYEYIVLDTPPVLGTADVNLIEDSADGVLLTAWARTTPSQKLRQAIDQLVPSKVLGVTLLDV